MARIANVLAGEALEAGAAANYPVAVSEQAGKLSHSLPQRGWPPRPSPQRCHVVTTIVLTMEPAMRPRMT